METLATVARIHGPAVCILLALALLFSLAVFFYRRSLAKHEVLRCKTQLTIRLADVNALLVWDGITASTRERLRSLKAVLQFLINLKPESDTNWFKARKKAEGTGLAYYGIARVAEREVSCWKTARIESPRLLLKLPERMKAIRARIVPGDYAAAEDCLSVAEYQFGIVKGMSTHERVDWSDIYLRLQWVERHLDMAEAAVRESDSVSAAL